MKYPVDYKILMKELIIITQPGIDIYCQELNDKNFGT